MQRGGRRSAVDCGGGGGGGATSRPEIVAVDFYSYAYHLVGHKIPEAWAIHRFHHKFWNPTPFGVIADDCVDQVVRAMPLLFLPLLIDTLNAAVLASVFALDLYYGVLLHSGHENRTARKVAIFFQGLTGTDIINTPLNHFLHHAISGGRRVSQL